MNDVGEKKQMPAWCASRQGELGVGREAEEVAQGGEVIARVKIIGGEVDVRALAEICAFDKRTEGERACGSVPGAQDLR